ncbi:glycosyltransferase family 2 protein [Alteromonas sp. S005]|uniref:glycosyltransferase family 2 protein n=1 Tax=Alteromonas sp. S005 TaxID=3117400 RepID=UPI002FE09098
MKFTVVIPTFNRAQLLKKCIDSIVVQTHPADEIIIIDDGSDDETEQIISSFQIRQIKYIRQQNTGQMIARFNGINMASNKWIALCDSDDIWEPNHLEVLNNVIKSYSDLDLVYSNFYEFGSASTLENKLQTAPAQWLEKSIAARENNTFFHQDLFKHLLYFTPIFQSCLAFNKESYFEFSAFSEEISKQNLGAEDFYSILIFALKGKVAGTFKKTVGIRKHMANHSASAAFSMEGEITIIQQILKENNRHPVVIDCLEEINNAIIQRQRALSYLYYEARDYKRFNAVLRAIPFEFKNMIKKCHLHLLSYFISDKQ